MKTQEKTSAPVDLLGLTNTDSEAAVLHCMIEDISAAIQLSEFLEPDDFHDSRRAIIFESIRLLLLGIEPIDTASILAEAITLITERKLKITIDEAYIDSLDQGDARRFMMYANSVKKLAWLRRAAEYSFWLIQELQGRPKPDDLFAAAMERWQMLAPKTKEERFIYGWDTLKAHNQIIEDRVRGRLSGDRIRYDWKWASWRRLIRPLQPGFVGIIAAADGVGKTTYLEEIGEFWASQKIHTVYVHLEDNLQYKLDRRLARHSRVDIAKIQEGEFNPEELERVKVTAEKLEAWAGYLHYLDAAGDTMTTVLRELQAKVDEGVCQAIVVDYLDKFQPSRGQIQLYSTNTWERQANDMEMLKVFCTKNAIPAMTATQGNKAMQGSGVQTRASIQGSGQKSQKAQLVVLLQRELVGPEGVRDPQGNLLAESGQYSPVVKLRIDKQNIGQTGNFEQYLDGKFFHVFDVPFMKVVEPPPPSGTKVKEEKAQYVPMFPYKED